MKGATGDLQRDRLMHSRSRLMSCAAKLRVFGLQEGQVEGLPGFCEGFGTQCAKTPVCVIIWTPVHVAICQFIGLKWAEAEALQGLIQNFSKHETRQVILIS